MTGPSSPRPVSLAALNSAPDDAALRADLAACCAAGSWVTALVAGRPFADPDELFAASDAAIAELTDAGLAEANAAYEQRFGQVYLVCATGKSAEELLAICRSRLGNDPATERSVVLAELAKISRLRLGKLLTGEGETAR